MDIEKLDEYIGGILDEKKVQVPDDVRVQLVADMRQRLLDLCNRAMIEALSDDKVDQLNTLLDNTASEEELQRFFSEALPDQKNIISSVLIRFREQYLA